MDYPEFRLRHNLTAILSHRGMTAAELSRKTGVAKQVLSDWMAGVQPRKLEHLYSVALTLGVSIDSLCFACSTEELLRSIASPVSPQTPSTANDVQELRGRYEVMFRRISDE